MIFRFCSVETKVVAYNCELIVSVYQRSFWCLLSCTRVVVHQCESNTNCALGLEGYHSCMLGLGVRVRY